MTRRFGAFKSEVLKSIACERFSFIEVCYSGPLVRLFVIQNKLKEKHPRKYNEDTFFFFWCVKKTCFDEQFIPTVVVPLPETNGCVLIFHYLQKNKKQQNPEVWVVQRFSTTHVDAILTFQSIKRRSIGKWRDTHRTHLTDDN